MRESIAVQVTPRYASYPILLVQFLKYFLENYVLSKVR